MEKRPVSIRTKLSVRLRAKLEESEELIELHPVLCRARCNRLNAAQRKRYTIAQFGISMVWPGFLAILNSCVETPRFKRTLGDNPLCEVGGVHEEADVSWARIFANNQGWFIEQIGRWTRTKFNQQLVVGMLELDDEPEEVKAGYMLGNEALAAVMFEGLLPAFARVAGCDTRYLEVHITVDRDEHVRDVAEGISEMLRMGGDEDSVLAGLELAISDRMTYLVYIEERWSGWWLAESSVGR